MTSTAYIVSITDPGNCTSQPEDIATILTSRDHIAPRDRVEVEAYTQPAVMYEIELDGHNFYGEHYYYSVIVRGPAAPAGDVPDCVDRHARLLRAISGASTCTYRIGYHEPVTLHTDGRTDFARTVWLTEPR